MYDDTTAHIYGNILIAYFLTFYDTSSPKDMIYNTINCSHKL